VIAAALCGAFYSWLHNNAPTGGALAGATIASSLFLLERFLLRGGTAPLFGRLPFLPYFALRSAAYVCVIVLAVTVVNGLRFGAFVLIEGGDLLFSLALSVGANLLIAVNELLGPGVLFAFAAGRYHQPRIEERALLFIDMRSSTAIAERLGDLAYLNFLNRFVADVSLAIAEESGEIHKYVGDEVIATWKLAPGANEPACVRACFAAVDRLREQGPAYERAFGQRADFRAAIHYGPVAVGELGTLKKEIALIGDAMNAAARIHEVCREADQRVLASAALIDRLASLPARVAQRRLGELPMRGKAQLLELFVLEAHADGR
jgi:adenylate cyclase